MYSKNAKLIVEFMDWEYIEHLDKYKTPFNSETYDGDLSQIFTLYEMLFHVDWNWLMSIVEKIESLDYRVEIFNNRCDISYNGDIRDFPPRPDIEIMNFENKIQNTYNAVIKFIKWYNKR